MTDEERDAAIASDPDSQIPDKVVEQWQKMRENKSIRACK